MDLFYFILHFQKFLFGNDFFNEIQWVDVLTLFDQAHLFFHAWVTHGQFYHETVQLGFRQHLGSGRSYRVLGCHYDKWVWQLSCDTVYRYLSLFHYLQKSRLCLGRCTVDLVCQQQVAKDSPRFVLEFTVGTDHIKSYYITWQYIRCKLQSSLCQFHGTGKSNRQCCLSYTRYIFDQNMSFGQNGCHSHLDGLVLSADYLSYFIQYDPYLSFILNILLNYNENASFPRRFLSISSANPMILSF